jgi:phytoene synthase
MNLEASYQFCETVARAQARNFYYSFLLLPKPKRRAMCAIYAFMRYCDDLSDDASVRDRAGAIANWRADLEAALAGGRPAHQLWPAFADTVRRYNIPHNYFFEMIEGVSSDLERRRIRTFGELYAYCYQVASVVGLTIIHIFGFENPEALRLAEKCGVAFQLTNILRDVREDAANDRIYLPEEDLARFHLTAEDLRTGRLSAGIRELLMYEANRARDYYREAAPLIGMVHADARKSLRALIAIYSRLLDRITEAGYDVFTARVRVPTWNKLWILLSSQWK